MFDFLRQEYAAARLRAMKGRLIGKARLSKLANAKSVSEIANVLEGTDYEPVFYHGLEKDVMEMENDLDRVFVNLLEKIKGFYYGKEKFILDVFLKEWETRNLKFLVKSILVGEDWEKFLVPLKGINLEELSKSKDVDDLAAKLKDTDYYEPIYSGYKNIDQLGPQIIDFYLDRKYAEICLNIAKDVKEREMLVSYIKTRNDLINLRNIVRAITFKKDLSEFFIEPSSVRREWFKTGSVELLSEKLRTGKFGLKDLREFEDETLFELLLGKNLEDLVLKFLRSSPFDTGLLLYFIVMKRNEINRIKIITKFIKENLDRGDLKILLGLGE